RRLTSDTEMIEQLLTHSLGSHVLDGAALRSILLQKSECEEQGILEENATEQITLKASNVVRDWRVVVETLTSNLKASATPTLPTVVPDLTLIRRALRTHVDEHEKHLRSLRAMNGKI